MHEIPRIADTKAAKDAGADHLVDPYSRPRLRPFTRNRPRDMTCVSPLGALGASPGRLVRDAMPKCSERTCEIGSDPEPGEAGLQGSWSTVFPQPTPMTDFNASFADEDNGGNGSRPRRSRPRASRRARARAQSVSSSGKRSESGTFTTTPLRRDCVGPSIGHRKKSGRGRQQPQREARCRICAR